MILVDTTVWIDFFHGRNSASVNALEKSLVENEDLCICGVILTEVLQGIREEKDYIKTRSLMDDLVYLSMDRNTYLKAAEIYRKTRRKGVTIRKAADCMIASVAIEHDIPLLHHDRDFDPLEKYCGLQTVKTKSDG